MPGTFNKKYMAQPIHLYSSRISGMCEWLSALLSIASQKVFFYAYGALLLSVLSGITSDSFAQSYSNLERLKGYRTETYFSQGREEKAKQMAERLDRVMRFYNNHLGFAATVTLLILSPEDWSTHTSFPVYGMPHYTGNKTLIVASDDNTFWKSSIPQLDQPDDASAQLFRKTYMDTAGGLTLESFFDLLTIHELGHAYHNQGELVMQRKWLGEFFSNLLLHVYIAENEPQLLPTLTVFPKTYVARTDKKSLKFTTLQELEAHYDEIGPHHPKNYAWYQCRLHMAASDVYDQTHIAGLTTLWHTLKAQRKILDDDTLATLLRSKTHHSLADILLKWK